MKHVIPIALAAVLCAGCRMDEPSVTSMPSDSVEVSFDLAGQGGAAILVPVHVNGRGPFQFVLDTGATMTCVAETLADSLQLPEQRGRAGLGASVESTGRLRLVSVDSLRVGEVRATGLSACTLDLTSLQQAGLNADGLLGLNFLRSFRMTLVFDRSIVRFER